MNMMLKLKLLKSKRLLDGLDILLEKLLENTWEELGEELENVLEDSLDTSERLNSISESESRLLAED